MNGLKKRTNKIEWVGEQLVVTTRSGKTYKFEEQLESIVSKCKKIAEVKKRDRNNISVELDEELLYEKLIVKSCVDPILKEVDFNINSLLASEAMALKKAVDVLYDLEAFL